MLTVHWCCAPADCKRGPTPTDFEEWAEPFLFQLPRSHDVVAGSYLGSFQGVRHKRVCVWERREKARESGELRRYLLPLDVGEKIALQFYTCLTYKQQFIV